MLGVDSILEAAVSKRADRLVHVVHALQNARTLELVDNNFFVLATLAVEDKFSNAWLIGALTVMLSLEERKSG